MSKKCQNPMPPENAAKPDPPPCPPRKANHEFICQAMPSEIIGSTLFSHRAAVEKACVEWCERNNVGQSPFNIITAGISLGIIEINQLILTKLRLENE